MSEPKMPSRWHRFVVLDEISGERDKQDRKWGIQHHPDGTGDWRIAGQSAKVLLAIIRSSNDSFTEKTADGGKRRFVPVHSTRMSSVEMREERLTWMAILLEEVLEAAVETDPQRLREELIQVAAVAVKWVEDIDQRESK